MPLAGATVMRGPLGVGHSEHLHNAKILPLSVDLPVVVEIVDSDVNVQRCLPVRGEMIGDGLATLEKVQVLRFGQAPEDAVSADVGNAAAHLP
jgi:PII-like signaling protein